MSQTTTVLFCLFLGTAMLGADAHLGKKGAQGFLALKAEMQPEVVARTLMHVEDEWKAQAAAFAECNAAVTEAEQEEGGNACSTAVKAFQKSCSTIVSTVVQASSGDRTVVQEYMGDVCGEKAFDEWHQGRCSSLSTAVVNAMSADSYDNRENFAAGSVCSGFWSSFVVEEQERVKKEKAEQAVREKEEEAQRVKAAQEAAEAEQKHEQEEAERKAAAEKARVEAEEEAAKHALQVNANSSNVVQANASNVSTHVQVSSENTTASSNATLTATDSAVTTPAPVADMANVSAPVTNATQKKSQPASNVSVAVVSVSNATASQNASVTQKEAAKNASAPKTS